jgi:hypothetical protein
MSWPLRSVSLELEFTIGGKMDNVRLTRPACSPASLSIVLLPGKQRIT